ncbi:hypothetical protein O9992_11670 [Vibrio lentus]|nr:hypothetical protein [Vibrio lentus]
MKDMVGVAGFLFLFCCYVLFFNPEWVGTSLSRLTLKLQTH